MSRSVDDFLVEIASKPDDDALKHVFADWLLERGDPRGELVALQLKDVRTDEDLSREALLLRNHVKQWLPDEVLINVVPSSIVFEKGVFAAARVMVRSPSAMLASLSHPVWSTVRRLDAAPVELVERCPLLEELTGVDEESMRRLLKRTAPLPSLRTLGTVGRMPDRLSGTLAVPFLHVRELRLRLFWGPSDGDDVRRVPQELGPILEWARSGASGLQIERLVLHSGWVDLEPWLETLEQCVPELQLTPMDFSPTDWWIRFRGEREVRLWPGSHLNASFSEGLVREILATAPRGFFKRLSLPEHLEWQTVRRLPCFEDADIGTWPES